MPGITIKPANQRVPSYYVNRHFAISFNLPKLAVLADPTKSFPSIGQPNAMALASLALNRLMLALAGRAQAAAGQTAGWDAEIVLAKQDATNAEAALAAANPLYTTSADVLIQLRRAATPVPAPATLNVS